MLMADQNSSKSQVNAAETAPAAGKHGLWSGRGIQFWIFCILLVLALAGMGLTQSAEGGGARYWLVVLLAYAAFSLARSWIDARKHHESIWSQIYLHVFHWLGALVALYIVFMFEHYEILTRDAASDVSLIILALASYLAGLHFERLFLLLGIILAAMAVAGSFVEQYTLWMIVIPTSLIAAWLFLKSRFAHVHS